MFKISDYAFIILSFLGLLFFYLAFSMNISVNPGVDKSMDELDFPADYSILDEYESGEPELAILCGSRSTSRKTQNMAEMAAQLKKEYAVFETVDDMCKQQTDKLTAIVVTANSWEELGDADKLLALTEEKGINLIFSGVPEDETGAYNNIIGILENKGTASIEGVMISEELFIQGMMYFDDLNLYVSDITLDGRCRKLMIERNEEKTRQTDLIPLIWEKRYGNGCFYGVNGDFLDSEYGIGFLTGIFSEIEDDFVYPVVNAKANLLDCFPELDNEYENAIQELYYRDTNMFIRDTIWPALVKLSEANTVVFSARLSRPVSETNTEDYNDLAELFERRSFEIDDSLETETPELPYLCYGHERNNEDIFKMKCSISGAGLATHYIDMSEVMGKNADNDKYEWSAYYLELSKFMYDLNQDTDWMNAVTESEALERYKRYLLLRPVIEKTNEEINIRTENFHDQCFYIIRTDKMISSGEGYEADKIGDNAYLISVSKEDITISLQ